MLILDGRVDALAEQLDKYRAALRKIVKVQEKDSKSLCRLGRGYTSGVEDCAWIAEDALAKGETSAAIIKRYRDAASGRK